MVEESVLFSEVSLLKCVIVYYTWDGKRLLEKCPQFRSVLIEGFHCRSTYSTPKAQNGQLLIKKEIAVDNRYTYKEGVWVQVFPDHCTLALAVEWSSQHCPDL